MTQLATSAIITPVATSQPGTARVIWSRLLCVAATTLCLALLLANVYVLPHFVGIFQDFDTKLPSATLLLINFSRFTPYLIFLGLVAVGLPIKEFTVKPRWTLIWINLVVLTWLCLMAIFYFVSLVLPILALASAV